LVTGPDVSVATAPRSGAPFAVWPAAALIALMIPGICVLWETTGGIPPCVRYIANLGRYLSPPILRMVNSTCAFKLSLDISKTLS